jgi:hypothetical protein
MAQTVQRRRSLRSNKRHRRSPVRPRLVRLRLSPKLSVKLAAYLRDTLLRLPELTGYPIRVRFESQLTAHRGKLLRKQPERGAAVYGATFLRCREVVLDADLIRRPRLLQLILIHELLHFVWLRLGNKARRGFAELLVDEYAHRAKGELGESSAVKKSQLTHSDWVTNSKFWREYVCESFCDTGAWLYSNRNKDTPIKLGTRWKRRREMWFEANLARCAKC